MNYLHLLLHHILKLLSYQQHQHCWTPLSLLLQPDELKKIMKELVEWKIHVIYAILISISKVLTQLMLYTPQHFPAWKITCSAKNKIGLVCTLQVLTNACMERISLSLWIQLPKFNSTETWFADVILSKLKPLNESEMQL